MIERKTREYRMIRAPGRNPNGVIAALEAVRSQHSEQGDDIFKTVTTDNRSEFSMLSEPEELSKTLVYFAHLCLLREGIRRASQRSDPQIHP